MEGAAQLASSVTNTEDHWTLNEDLDTDSLHSFHYSPKAVDMPSAVRLAKRLFYLEGFKKSDVSRHLSKKYSENKTKYFVSVFNNNNNNISVMNSVEL